MKKRTKSYSREFKLEADRLSHQSDLTVAEVASELGSSKSSLSRWRHELADDPEQAIPGRGQMKDRDAEIALLHKELREALYGATSGRHWLQPQASGRTDAIARH